jgi:hypothetical protein
VVSDHAYLFDSKDVERVYRGRYTRAEMCLRSLGENGKKTRNSWKGWVFLRKSPGTARDSLDFIGVRYIDSEKQEAAA